MNDPSNPTFNSSQPSGEAVFAPSAADLESVFQQIASKALFRNRNYAERACVPLF